MSADPVLTGERLVEPVVHATKGKAVGSEEVLAVCRERPTR
jgi:hypothetical protein